MRRRIKLGIVANSNVRNPPNRHAGPQIEAQATNQHVPAKLASVAASRYTLTTNKGEFSPEPHGRRVRTRDGGRAAGRSPCGRDRAAFGRARRDDGGGRVLDRAAAFAPAGVSLR